jgi:O-antigen/teichoic acid export membrane protein
MSWQQGVATTAAWFIFSANPMIVGYWLGEAAVSALAVPTRMAMLLFSMLGEVSGPQLNFMVQLIGERDVPNLLRKFFLALLFTALPGLVAYGTLAAVGVPFIRWWTLGRVELDFHTLGWLTLYCWLALVQLQAACFVTAHGRQPFALAAVIGALLNLSLACILLPRIGLSGATLATFLAQLVTSNWYALWLAAKLLVAYARKAPGVVTTSFRNAAHEIFSLRFFKTLFTR